MDPIGVPLDFMDDLLNFDVDELDKANGEKTKALNQPTSGLSTLDEKNSEQVVEEEELEWITNKDAFPEIDSFIDIFTPPYPPKITKTKSPVSVLKKKTDSSTSTGDALTLAGGWKVPGGPRSKRRRISAAGLAKLKLHSWAKPLRKKGKVVQVEKRKCLHCQAEKTPQWRPGPMGPKTLCNACGVRYKKGQLVPEYRPANSPTFSTELHSNMHRKVMEMRSEHKDE